MSLNELINKRKKLLETMDGFLETHKNANGTLSKEDDEVYSGMEKEFDELTASISRLQRREEIEKEMNKPVNKPLTSKPMSETLDSKPTHGRASAEYKKALFEALRSNFRKISNILSEGTDANGGYLVPEETDAKIVQKLEEENIFRQFANVITTSGDHKINIGATDPAAAWIEEGGSLSFGDATFSQVLLDAHKLHVAVKVTDELLYDSAFDLETYLIEKFAKALSNSEEDAYINGDGVGKPLGILADKGGAEVGVVTASEKITADEILNLVYSLKRPYRKNAFFICNDNTLLAIRKLKDLNGNYLWQPSIKEGEPDRLLGYPVRTTAYFPTIGAGKKVLAFGDYSYYTIGDRGIRSFDQLKELFAGNGMVAFLAKERVDGKLVLPEAIKVLQIKESTTTEPEEGTEE